MESFMRQWASDNQDNLLIKRKQFMASTIEEINDFVKEYTDSNFTHKILERKTNAGFQMKLHRDEYRFDNNAYKRGTRDDSLWIPIYNVETRPIYTVVWYHSTQGKDFIGGNLRFYDGFMMRPTENAAILFDSNDLHEVTLQQTKEGINDMRHTSVVKFYKN